jgi:hypothetical protein
MPKKPQSPYVRGNPYASNTQSGHGIAEKLGELAVKVAPAVLEKLLSAPAAELGAILSKKLKDAGKKELKPPMAGGRLRNMYSPQGTAFVSYSVPKKQITYNPRSVPQKGRGTGGANRLAGEGYKLSGGKKKNN